MEVLVKWNLGALYSLNSPQSQTKIDDQNRVVSFHSKNTWRFFINSLHATDRWVVIMKQAIILISHALSTIRGDRTKTNSRDR
jgi:hypothetical protein